MSNERSNLEQIVRDVVARLTASERTDEVSPCAVANRETLRLDEPLITLATLEGRLAGTRRVEVAERTVITPAARDYLSARNILLLRNSAPSKQGEPAKLARLLVGVAESEIEPAGWLDSPLGRQIELEQLARADLVDLVDEMARRVATDRVAGVLLTDAPDAALCVANRHSGVRAIGGLDAEGVRRARRTIAANLLVAQPSRQSPFALRQMAAAMLDEETYTCTEKLRSRLR